MDEEFCLITTAVDDSEFAHDLAKRLVEKHLAACVQVVPVESTYRWKGNMVSGAEFMLIIKTLSRLYVQVERAIREDHPYELPEVIRISIDGGFQQYLEWMIESVE